MPCPRSLLHGGRDMKHFAYLRSCFVRPFQGRQAIDAGPIRYDRREQVDLEDLGDGCLGGYWAYLWQKQDAAQAGDLATKLTTIQTWAGLSISIPRTFTDPLQEVALCFFLFRCRPPVSLSHSLSLGRQVFPAIQDMAISPSNESCRPMARRPGLTLIMAPNNESDMWTVVYRSAREVSDDL